MRDYNKEAEAVCKYIGGTSWKVNLSTMYCYDTVAISMPDGMGYGYSLDSDWWKELVVEATKMTDEEIDNLCVMCAALSGDVQMGKEELDGLNRSIDRLTRRRDDLLWTIRENEEELKSVRNKLRGN